MRSMIEKREELESLERTRRSWEENMKADFV